MWRHAVLILTLTSCNAWVRPTPPPARPRVLEEQRGAVVRIESYCSSFDDDDGALASSRVGSGVMVSDWQVLTALHVVECTSAIPTIRVYNNRRERWRFAPEKEWVIEVDGFPRDGISRIQLASADTLDPRLPPPRVDTGRVNYGDQLYVEAGSPDFIEHYANGTGWEFGGAGYGGNIFTYRGATEDGNSGAGIYDYDGELVGIHLGSSVDGTIGYGAAVTDGMVP